MKFEEYDFSVLEPEIQGFWDDNSIVKKSKDRSGKPFYFLDGPPYTSGNVHVGTAWNKSMKDTVVRLRRLQGRDVFDRAGYDMHGLPNEHGTMKDLGLETKEDILAYGLDRFVTACKERAASKLAKMNKDFSRLGVWLDFENAYQTMSDEWMESVWWLVKKAYEDGRLYEGLRPMAWDPVHESACAKHELFYKSVEDTSIYVKFRRLDSNEFFVVWTTTPWTIPFNLMIMMNPQLEYARVAVGDEVWIIAKSRVDAVLEAAEVSGEIVETVLGKSFAGAEYEHFLSQELGLDKLKQEFPNVHTVVLSAEYVGDDAGSGLVHAAPGCGPEDYEVGIQNNVPAFNTLDERGRFPEGSGVFSGKTARTDDEYFTQVIDEHKHLVAAQRFVHDYPHAERSKAPVVYKATKQWFFRVADRKDELIAANNAVSWNPQAGFNAFNSWLENLRDNSITKQRYWGTPIPVWKNVDDPDDIIVVGSRTELQELAGSLPKDLHKPWIDDVVIKKDGKVYRRIPDIIDVWVDAGVASFAALGFPQNKELFDKFFPADFIIEGNDQVRGWFNLLMIAGMLGFDKAPFTNVYMHGMINDAQGRKMSKSVGNYITPEEVVAKFGADACRLYWIGGAKAGLDLNYNHDDCQQKHRNLFVYFNMHKYILDLQVQAGKAPVGLPAELQFEDRYALSITHRALKLVAEHLDAYAVDKIPDVIENALQELSRTYIQLVRPRVQEGDEYAVLQVLAHCYQRLLVALSALCPYISEGIWQNLKEPLQLSHESVHLAMLDTDYSFVDDAVEEEMASASRIISTLLAARDQAQIGVRWPLLRAITNANPLSDAAAALVKSHTNVRALEFSQPEVSYVLAPNFRALGKRFGQQTPEFAQAISTGDYGEEFAKKGSITVQGEELGKEFLEVSATAPDGFSLAQDNSLLVMLDTAQSDELLLDGFFRELVRRVQQLRKQADMVKQDRVIIVLSEDVKDIVSGREEELCRLTGGVEVRFGDPDSAPHHSSHSVSERELRVGLFLR